MDKTNGNGRLALDLARTGPGTPMGRFMRRFWMPVYRAEDLPTGGAKPIRIMSEDFALYRGASGQAQVIDYRCPHRGAQRGGASLSAGQGHAQSVLKTASVTREVAGNYGRQKSSIAMPTTLTDMPITAAGCFSPWGPLGIGCSYL